MNNQAAQTMPEPVTASMCPSSDYAKGWNDCLAAMLAAAQAASGGEVWTREMIADVHKRGEELFQRINPPSAASVSERERLLLAAACDSVGLYETADGLRANLKGLDLLGIRSKLLAIEQALTQQRGECWPLNKNPKDGWTFDPSFLDEVKTRAEQSDIGEFAPCLEGVESVLIALRGMGDTTPQPGADAVREYVTELRAQADQKMGVAGACAHDGDRARYKSAAQLLRRVADELESLLSAASGEGVDDTKRLDWIARQGGYEFDFGILNDQPGDGDWFVHGMGGSGQGATFRDAIDAAIKEEAGGQDANTDILDTLAFKTENGDAGRGSVTYIALVASGEADHATTTPQPSADAVRDGIRMDWLVSKAVEVRDPLRHGSRAMFHAQTASDEDEPHRTTLREQIDAAMADELESLLSGGSHA
jgi:hypothetical protein